VVPLPYRAEDAGLLSPDEGRRNPGDTSLKHMNGLAGGFVL
jgi:hypothetical protein